MKSILRYAAFILLFVSAALSQTPDRRTVCHVSGIAMPASQTAPSCMEGRTLNYTVSGQFLIISNTSSSDQTVTVYDGGSTPFKLFDAYPIKALHTWTVPLGGVVFVGGVKWSASSTSVMGTFYGY